ncbi:MAG TPA: hypothetical protein VGR55_01335 [Candidatus Acidoferrum sp.]|nr:hypothetical protein [Candidatus Acidoferrum sp.]
MSWTDTILANTVGVLFSARTGAVDPWTLQQIKDDAHAANAVALGANDPNSYGPVDPGLLAATNAQSDSSIDSHLRSINAHPDQPCVVRLPGLGCVGSTDFLKKLEHLVYGLLFVGGLAGAAYFTYHYRRTLKEYMK